MGNRHRTLWLSAFYASILVAVSACHADPDDAAGQAKELSDPVRRENAVANLTRIYAKALSDNGGNRDAAPVKKVADASQAQLTQTYVDHADDVQNGIKILDLLVEMRDPRTLPALLKGLEWRSGVNEEHAIRAARAIEDIALSEGDKKKAVAALGSALEKVTGKQPIDNRMRVEFLRALGSQHDRAATPVLIKIATQQRSEQNFLINRLAAEQLAAIADPSSVPTLVKGLFLFSPANPGLRMNDVAAQGLVAIGKPALTPLLKVLEGKDEDANAIAEAYIKAVRARDAGAAEQMSVRSITASEAAYALGQLGSHEALAPLLAETKSGDETRKLAAAVALVSLDVKSSDFASVRGALESVYGASEKATRPQLLVAMQHTFDPGVLPFLLQQAKKPEDELPDIRVVAVRAYSMIANKAEAASVRQLISDEPGPDEGGFRVNFEQNKPALDAADKCDEKLDCWIQMLGDKNAMVVRKAAYMIARVGRGNAAAVKALVAKFDHPDEHARGDIFYALDHVAVQGSSEAIEKISAIAKREEGHASWNRLKTLALAVQARLRGRAGQSALLNGHPRTRG